MGQDFLYLGTEGPEVRFVPNFVLVLSELIQAKTSAEVSRIVRYFVSFCELVLRSLDTRNIKMKRILEESSPDANVKRRCTVISENEDILDSFMFALRFCTERDCVKNMLENIEDLNIYMCYGYCNRTPLHYAIAWNCHWDIIEAMISKGANINSKDNVGLTPLHSAITSNRASDYVPRLLSLGADVNARTLSGQTPLYLAVCQFKELSVCEELLRYGANTDFVYDDFFTELGFFTILDKSVAVEAYSSAKLLIKTIFLKNFRKNLPKVMKLKEDPIYNIGDLPEFMERVLSELELMQKTKLTPASSVSDFAVFGNNLTTKALYTIPELTAAELRAMFPIYQDIVTENIASALQRGQNINQFRYEKRFNVSFRNDEDGKYVSLNFDCVEKIFGFLNDRELLNFTIAFYFG